MYKRLALLYGSFYLSKVSYFIGAGIVLLFALSFFIPLLFVLAQLLLLLWLMLMVIDVLLLYTKRRALLAGRICQSRFSNGDENPVTLQLYNNYSFPIQLSVVDEIPIQFQERNWERKAHIKRGEKYLINYVLRPVERGEYHFGKVHAFVCSPLSMVQRRFSFPAEETVQVYPSYQKLRKYSLMAMSNQLAEAGSKRLRKLGNSTEFEQIKEYVRGDDYRTINWKATARKSQLMVNTFVDEKSQQVYCIIDKSRNMQMPFDGMTLLDHAINATLMLTSVALHKQDRAGLVTFAQTVDTFYQ